jgi:hypothetical protein
MSDGMIQALIFVGGWIGFLVIPYGLGFLIEKFTNMGKFGHIEKWGHGFIWLILVSLVSISFILIGNLVIGA